METIAEIGYHVLGKDPNMNRKHNDLCVEILQARSTGGNVFVRNRIFPIEFGSVYIVNAIETHYTNPSDPDQYCRNKIILSSRYFSELAQSLRFPTMLDSVKKNAALHFRAADGMPAEIIDGLFQKTAEAFSSDSDIAHAETVCCTLQILVTLFRHSANVSLPPNKQDKLLSAIMNYVNLAVASAQPFSIDKMCRELFISESYASHFFKKINGNSLSRYYVNVKLATAKKMLTQTDMSISEISQALNYATPSAFSKAFKAGAGCTPGQYRGQIR
ncbi:MAG: AraC family transcriptional regulator [Oscillospiraceae bacterium]|jgi:AraC-like DNA-binding protein|nr:AraC family transcriptional regulator [Oscillospiraceae bacterium]